MLQGLLRVWSMVIHHHRSAGLGWFRVLSETKRVSPSSRANLSKARLNERDHLGVESKGSYLMKSDESRCSRSYRIDCRLLTSFFKELIMGRLHLNLPAEHLMLHQVFAFPQCLSENMPPFCCEAENE